ncbi:MAG: LysE family translocator [Gammaproteobacteria bacterium]|nr:LysE family translocator [Gammaproteobacteria bacterium]
MTNELLTALIVFAVVSTITPGPNNLMLMSSGANFGFKRTIPHMLGIGLGFAWMVALVGIGLIEVFDRFPVSHDILKVASIGYLLYLAYKIATSQPIEEQGNNKVAPLTFIQSAAFQWVNPKAWSMALTAISVYSPSRSLESIALVSIIFALANIPSVSLWTVLGQQLRRLLSSTIRLRAFNWTMAGLLVASIYPTL